MNEKPKLVIIGNGMAPGRMLEHLCDARPDAYDVTIFNAEPRVNYNRLMLSPVLSERSNMKISLPIRMAGTPSVASRCTRHHPLLKSTVTQRPYRPQTASVPATTPLLSPLDPARSSCHFRGTNSKAF